MFQGSNNAEFAEAVLSKLPDDIEVGLVFFAIKTIPMVPLTKDHSKLLFPLEALRSGDYSDRGGTALRSAVVEAAKIFGTPRIGDTVYLISDGGENESKAQEADVNAGLGGSGIRLFALMVISEENIIGRRSREELEGAPLMQGLVSANGGTIVPKFGTRGVASDTVGKKGQETQLGKEVSQQIEQILNFYRLDITLPEPTDKPRKLNLILKGFDRSTSRKLKLIYPNILAHCQ